MDLSSLTPEQLQQLKAQLATVPDPNGRTSDGRSPFRERQLHDLRLLPTADDPRPTFFWSAEQPRDSKDYSKTSLYPRLMWHKETGEEITVYNLQQERERGSFYQVQPPFQIVLTPQQELQELLAGLTEQERATILDAQHAQRLDAIKDRLAALSDDQLEAVVGSLEIKPKQKKSA